MQMVAVLALDLRSSIPSEKSEGEGCQMAAHTVYCTVKGLKRIVAVEAAGEAPTNSA